MVRQRTRQSGPLLWWALIFICSTLATSVTWAAGSRPIYRLDIPAGPADKTLRLFQNQTGLQVIWPYDDVTGIYTNAISGRFDAETALGAMTHGTRLRTEFGSEDSVTLTVVAPPALRSALAPRLPVESQGSAASVLPAVTVLGTALAPEGAVGSYAMTVSRLEIERSGRATLADVIRTLPQVFGGGPTEDTREIGREAQSNSGRGVGVNIRGLDAGAALVLLNGHRLAAGGADGTFVDVSNIPLLAIEAIELLPAGSSTRLGSDAIGGVLNIVTRRDTAVRESVLRHGWGASASFPETQVGQWFTRSWDSGDAQLALEYYAHGALAASRSRRTQSDLTGLGGDNWDSNRANPGTLIAGGSAWALPAGQDGRSLSAADLYSGENRANRLDGADVIAAQERVSLFGSTRHRLTRSAELLAEGLVSEREARGSSAPFAALIPVPPNNPFYVNPSPVPGPVQVGYSFGDDLGPIRGTTRVSTRSGAFGVDWERGAWRFTSRASYGSEAQRQRMANLVDTTGLLVALNDPDPETAFNAMGDGSHTHPATLGKIRARSLFTTYSQTFSGHLWGERSVAGAKLALGADLGNQVFRSHFVGGALGDDVRRNVDRDLMGGFAELAFPLFKGVTSRREGQKAEGSLGVRHDRYSDFGSATVPQVGVGFALSPALKLRARWRRAVRAPNLTDLLETQNVALIVPQRAPANVAASVPTLIWSGNNAQLSPERARSSSFGLEVSPLSWPEWSLALTYYVVDSHDRVVSAPFTNTMLNDPAYADRVNRNPTAAERSAVCERSRFFGLPGGCLNAPIAGIVDLRLRNLEALKTSGLDVMSRYSHSSSLGRWDLALNGNYVLRYAQALTRDAGLQDLLDTPNYPTHLGVRASMGLIRGDWDASMFANFTNRYRDTNSVPSRRVGSMTTFDVQAGYQFGEAEGHRGAPIRVALTVRNLFNRPAPFLNNPVGIGYDQENADPIGRTVHLAVHTTW